MHPGRRRLQLCLSIVVLGGYAGSALAIKGWDTNAGLTVQTIYSDNVDLVSEDAESDLGFRVTPSIGIRRETRFNQLDFQYGLSLLTHTSSRESDEIQNNLTADWKSELSRDVLFLELRANAGQTLLVDGGRRGGDSFNTNNTTQTYTYEFHPYVRHHFGGYADLLFGYTNDGVFYDGSSGDSMGNRVDFSLTSGREFQAISWSLRANYEVVEYQDSDDDDTFSNVRGDLGYRLNRYWEPSVYVAYEDNDYDSDSEIPQGFGYGAGVTWTPNNKLALYVVANSEGADIGAQVTWRPSTRTELVLGYGMEFLYKTWNFDFRHRMRRSVLTASYRVDPDAGSRDEILERQTFQLVDSFGNVVADPVTGQPILVDADTPTLDDQRYELRHFRLNYDLEFGRRNSLGLGGYYSRRDYYTSLDNEDTWGFDARWSHGMAVNLMSHLLLSWERFESNQEADSDNWSIGAGLTYNLTRQTSLTLDVQHNVEDSEDAADDYTENRVTLTLGTSW